MNDPGLDGPIDEDAKAIERKSMDEREEAEEDEQEFLAPSRWWFASTAFPLIAGTFGPMASAFSICALVEKWRVQIPPGSGEDDGDYIPDPPWLTGVNAAQLAVALVSNLFLLLNMARRVRFAIAQPVTIVGWYLSSFSLIALTATAAGPLAPSPPPDHAFTQGFYYATISAGLYFMVASLMVVTVIGAYKGHYEKDFKLTMSQRTLMLQTISFLVYLLAGAAVFAHIESWDYLDAVYWADFTLLTIGIGDFTPLTNVGRGLVFPYAMGGIIILGLVIGSIRSLVLERGKVKLGARMVEKGREDLLKRLSNDKDKQELLTPITKDRSRDSSRTLNDLSERQRRQAEFEMMRRIQKRAATIRRWTSLLISATTWFILWFAGAAIFMRSEEPQDWTYFNGLYFAYISLLTIGYGDLSPESNSGKAFFVFWSLLAIPSLTILISNMGDTIVKAIRDFTLWIGNFTVLPGDKGVRASIKAGLKQVSRGQIFPSSIDEMPPGILGESSGNRNTDDDTDNDGSGDNNTQQTAKAGRNDPESAGQRAAGRAADIETAQAHREGETNDRNARPQSQRHYHCLLIQEIGSVMRHLRSSPPRKYTFDEWAWYLRLIGEDEDDAATHRRALRHPNVKDGEGLATASKDQGEDGEKDKDKHGKDGVEEDEKKVKWSWIGNRSPLMGNKEEAEWVLERLVRALGRELQDLRREELAHGHHDKQGKGEKGGDGRKMKKEGWDRVNQVEDKKHLSGRAKSSGPGNDLEEGDRDDAGEPSMASSQTVT